jgi:hypothetical protein
MTLKFVRGGFTRSSWFGAPGPYCRTLMLFYLITVAFCLAVVLTMFEAGARADETPKEMPK